MRRILGVLVISLIILFSSGVVVAADTGSEIDAVIARWTQSLLNEDPGDFVSCYWDDAVRIVYFPGQDPEIIEGSDNIGASQKAAFDNMDFRTMNLIYDDLVRFFPEEGRPTYIYPNSRFSFMDVFEFEKRGREYRIIKQYIIPHPPGD